MASEYCTEANIYEFALTPGSLPNPAQLIYSVDAGADALTLSDHGFTDGQPVTFSADAAGGSLPSPLAEGVTYYALRLTEHRFSVASTVGGTAVNLTTAGSRVLVAGSIPFAAAIQWASAVIDDCLPGHIVPISAEAVPQIIRVTCAELAAAKLQSRQGSQQISLGTMITEAQKRVAMWAKGKPVRGTDSPPRAQLSRAATVPYADIKGWRSDTTI